MRSAGTADGDGRRERLQDKQEPGNRTTAVAARHDGDRPIGKDKVAEQLTDDWENWEIVRTEYVLKGRDTVPDTMQRIPAGSNGSPAYEVSDTAPRSIKKKNRKKRRNPYDSAGRNRKRRLRKPVKKSSAGRIALYAIGLVALWLALRSIGKWLL